MSCDELKLFPTGKKLALQLFFVDWTGQIFFPFL